MVVSVTGAGPQPSPSGRAAMRSAKDDGIVICVPEFDVQVSKSRIEYITVVGSSLLRGQCLRRWRRELVVGLQVGKIVQNYRFCCLVGDVGLVFWAGPSQSQVRLLAQVLPEDCLGALFSTMHHWLQGTFALVTFTIDIFKLTA